MPTVSFAPYAVPQFLDNAGAPVSGGTLETYLAGTSIPTATYADGTGETANPAVISLDSAGRPSNGGSLVDVRLDVTKAYRFVLKNSAGAIVRTVDNVLGGVPPASIGDGGITDDPAGLRAIVEKLGFTAPTGAALVGYLGTEPGADPITVMDRLRLGATIPQSYSSVPISTGEHDATVAIQRALAATGNVLIPPGTYRIDGKIVLNANQHLHLAAGATLTRLSAHSNNTDALVLVKGTYAWLSGNGTVKTENAHPNGIIQCGHENVTTSNWNALWWKVSDVIVEGVWAAGNVGVYVPSSQITLGSVAANYFGSIQNVTVRQADIGVLLTDMSNGHTIVNINFYRVITYAYKLVGAYANTILGGFLHTATNGVVGLGLLNSSPGGSSHNSSNNHVFGFGIEPGGAASRGVEIGTNCVRNKVYVTGNVAGGNSIANPNNDVDTGWSTYYSGGRYQNIESVTTTTTGTNTVQNSVTKSFTGTVVETQSAVVTTLGRSNFGGLTIRVTLSGFHNSLNPGGAEALFVYRRSGTGASVQTVRNDAAPGGLTIGTPIVNGTNIQIMVTAPNNGTGTTFTYTAMISVLVGSDRANLVWP